MSNALRNFGIEIPPAEDTPLVRRLVAINEQLVERVHQLEGRPALPKRDPAPSPLKDDSGPPSTGGKKNKRSKKRKRQKGLKRSKFKDLRIDDGRENGEKKSTVMVSLPRDNRELNAR